MNIKQLFTVVLTFALLFECSTRKSVSSVITVADKAIDILGLANTVSKFIDKSETNDFPDSAEKIIKELSDRIETLTTDIITQVVLQSKLERVLDAVINIHSALIDTENVFQATTASERKVYIELFVFRFEEHDVIKHVRFLPKLLEYNIPGTTGTTGKLVDLFADNTRCNMTAIYEFQWFYSNLLSVGIFLEAVYLRYKNITLNTTNAWVEDIDHIKEVFERQEQNCIKKFTENVQEDIKTASNASQLWINNKVRYPWKKCDVVFIESCGTFQFVYYKFREGHMFIDDSDKPNLSKIVICSDKNENKPNLEILTNGQESFNAAIKGEKDENAAKNVGEAVEEYLREQRYTLNALIVYFEGKCSSEKLIFDENSPVLEYTTDTIKLKYCYKSGFECSTDPMNLYKGTQKVEGKMKILVKVTNSSDDGVNYKTGSSIQNNPNTYLLCLLIATIMLFV